MGEVEEGKMLAKAQCAVAEQGAVEARAMLASEVQRAQACATRCLERFG